ncbi:MAG: hypothetical protein HFJ42_08655 [Clostridia bacterium]|nr:hypothetical protein [Clostridia bacterium]
MADLVVTMNVPMLQDLPGETLRGNTFIAKGLLDSSEIISDAVIDASKNIANSIENCGYEISRSIIASSQNVLLGLNRIADELERNNKTQEYYMLLKEIEKFEDYCIEHNIIKNVYSKIDLKPIKEIDEDEEDITFYEAKGLVIFVGNKICDIEEISIRLLMSPISVVATSILKYSGKDLGLSLPSYNKVEEKFWTTTHTLSELRKAILYSGCKDYNMFKAEYTLEQEEIISKHATKLLDIVSLIKQNICLNNLRTLHAQLRSAVRDYKIETAMANCSN